MEDNAATRFGNLSKENDPYKDFIGRYVEVTTIKENLYGRYQGIRDGHLYLSPCIVFESYPTEEKDKRITLVREIDGPGVISVPVVSMWPVREERLCSLIEDRGIIIARATK